jgi:hypothetical protein
MRRDPRVFHDLFQTINADVVIAPKWRRLSYWIGETCFCEGKDLVAPVER